MLYILIYITSGLSTWLLLRYILKKNEFSSEWEDVVFVICPVINTIAALIMITALLSLPIKKIVNRFNTRKFFKL